MIVGTEVAHNAYGTDVGKDGEVLPDGLVQTGLGDLLPEDRIGVADDPQLLLGDLTEAADGQTGAGEGLTADQVLRQAAYVVVALDNGGRTSFHVPKSVAEKESVGFLLHFFHSL